MQRFTRGNTQLIAFIFTLLAVIAVVVSVFIHSHGDDNPQREARNQEQPAVQSVQQGPHENDYGFTSQRDAHDQEQPVAESQPQGPHENDPGFTLRFTDQPHPKNPTPLEYCEFAIAVDPDIGLSMHKTTYLRGERGLEFVDEEITFLGGTRVMSRRSGFSNPHANYRLGHNMRILRADGTATLAHYGFAGGSACVVSEWREWDENLPYVVEAHKASQTMYFPGGTMVRVTMEPDYTREYPAVSPGMSHAHQEEAEFPPNPGVTLTSAVIISSDGVVTDIPISEQITTVRLNIGVEVNVEIGSYGDRVDVFAFERGD